jgi:hypothetical protein
VSNDPNNPSNGGPKQPFPGHEIAAIYIDAINTVDLGGDAIRVTLMTSTGGDAEPHVRGAFVIGTPLANGLAAALHRIIADKAGKGQIATIESDHAEESQPWRKGTH